MSSQSTSSFEYLKGSSYAQAIQQTLNQSKGVYYGNRSSSEGERTEIYLKNSAPVGLITYAKELQAHPFSQHSFELKNLVILNQENEKSEVINALFSRALEKAKNRDASAIHIKVEQSASYLTFFKQQGLKESADSSPLFYKSFSKKRKELETQFSSFQSPLSHEDISKREKVRIIPSLAVKNHETSLPKKFISMIRNQSKTVEGRIFKGFVNGLKVGDNIRFFYHQNQNDDVKCKITKIEKYLSFEKMLQSCGYSTCVPDASGLSAAVAAYHRIPNYLTLSKIHGVAAIHLQLIDVKK